MRTSEQPTAGPDEVHRDLTRRLADLAKSDSPRFTDVVKAADAAMARGVERDEAYRAALEGSSPDESGRQVEHPAERPARP